VLIRVGHSADPDDAFMFWALDAGRVDTRGFEFQSVVSDIQTLNEWACEGRLEVTAISLGAYPLVAERYVLLPHGASIGSGYGPVVVSRTPLDRDDLRGRAGVEQQLGGVRREADDAARGRLERNFVPVVVAHLGVHAAGKEEQHDQPTHRFMISAAARCSGTR
jgi:hypothetical protein